MNDAGYQISMGLVGVFGDGLRFATRWYTPELQFR